MANIYDPNLNKTILKTFKNFNSKIRYNKHKTRGKGMLPTIRSAKEFMDKYSDKSITEINKQLKLYQSFESRKSLEKDTESSRLSKWEADYFKANRAKTEAFYNQEIAELNNLIGDKPEYFLRHHNRLQTLLDNREFLQRDLSTLSEDQIKIMRSVYNYAERSEMVKQQGFRTYLSQLDRLLKLRKVSPAKREELLSKFDVLSENEFTEMVQREDIIDRIYELVNSPEKRGKYELTTDDANADAIIKELWSTADDLIAKYKKSK